LLDNAKQVGTIIKISNELATPCVLVVGKNYG
jgi:hypothetical protein